MRPILLSDLDAAARAILPLPQAERSAAVRALLDTADVADRFRRRLGRLAPGRGNGSLLAAARTMGSAARPDRCDAGYCAALALVLEELAAWRRERAGPRRQGGC